MTGICHCPQSYYSEEKDLTFRSVSLTPTITTISWRLSIILSKTLLRNWVFQINGILHWQSKWKGRPGQSKIRSVNSLAHLCLWMECLKSEHFPYSCILCQNNIHSHYCMLQAPASSIPYFVLLRGRWCLNFIIVMPIFIWKKVFLYYSLGLWHVQMTQEELYLIHSYIWSAKRHLKEKSQKDGKYRDWVRFSASNKCHILIAFEWGQIWRFYPVLKMLGKTLY